MSFEDMLSFEQSPWELECASLPKGGSISAVRLLALLEGEDEETAEDAFRTLEELSVTLELADLPAEHGGAELEKRLRLEEKLAHDGTLLQGLEENDPLRLYLEEMAAIPACGDISLLAQQLAQANRAGETDAPAQKQLLELSLSRVVQLAKGYTGRGVLLLDLIQEGSLGLWNAILAYMPGQDFEAHRDWWIRQYMAKAVTMQARAAGVGQKLRRAMEDYRSVDEKLLSELGRNPTLEEIAQGLHMTVQETAAVAEMLENARALHRAKTPEPEQLPQEEDQAVEDTAYFQMRQRIAELLSELPQEDAQLLTLRYGLEGGLPMNPQQVAQRMGITADEVAAREAQALKTLRQQQS